MHAQGASSHQSHSQQQQQAAPMEISAISEKRKLPEFLGHEEGQPDYPRTSEPGTGSRLMAFMKKPAKNAKWIQILKSRHVKGLGRNEGNQRHSYTGCLRCPTSQNSGSQLEERVAKLEREGPPPQTRNAGGRPAENDPASECHFLGQQAGLPGLLELH